MFIKSYDKNPEHKNITIVEKLQFPPFFTFLNSPGMLSFTEVTSLPVAGSFCPQHQATPSATIPLAVLVSLPPCFYKIE